MGATNKIIKIKDKYVLVLIFFAFSVILKAQQVPLYNQYIFNPLEINPAYAGARNTLSAVLIHRSQWTAIDGAPRTQNLAIHSPFKKENMALGGLITHDAIGPTNSFKMGGIYAYKIKAGKGHLGLGLRAGIQYIQFDWNKISYKDPMEPTASVGKTYDINPDFSFGIFYNTNSFFTGLAFDQLYPAKLNFTDSSSKENRLYRHSNLLIGKAFKLDEEVIFRPSLLIRSVEQITGTADLNLSFLFFNQIWFGFSLRSGYGLALLTEYQFSNGLRVGYSVDRPSNNLKGYSGLTHEIFIGWDLVKQKTVNPRFF